MKILERSPMAELLGMTNGDRLYDEIISRSDKKMFHKHKKDHPAKKRTIAFDVDVVDKDAP